LYLCAKIAELLGGTISAKNNRGGGATFRVLVPLERSHNPILSEELPRNEVVNAEFEHSETTAYLSTGKPTILVVEDNKDMRQFISSILCDDYKTIDAENGIEALQILKSKTIDFIVSDLMMPVMDGLELSKQVKSDFSISHIPFLMLTAKSNVETQINSYKLGVDDFLAKPFDPELLLARISNMLEARRNYQRKFSLNMDVKELNIREETNDEKFIHQAIQTVKENYKNPNYEVADFISDMGISKSLLNKKMNILTGQPAVQFIRNYRLAVAHELILKKKGNLNISEIAFEVGFNDPKYFTRCFAKHFGVAPSMLSRDEVK
jgi:DNA-binding response OmpR family regulator